MADGMITTLLVDDQELVRSGLRRILRRKDGIAVVGVQIGDGLGVLGVAGVEDERVQAGQSPEQLVVDIEGLEAGTQILAKDITLPEGVTLDSDEELLVVNITEQISAEALEAELADAEAEAGIEHDESDAEAAEGDAEATEGGEESSEQE